MNVKYASFSIPIYAGSDEESELNSFLSMHKIVKVMREFVPSGCESRWAFNIEYIHGNDEEKRIKPKTDYRELLSETEFTLFSALRNLRKKIAEAEGVAVYMIFTNEQLYKMVKEKVASKSSMAGIDGIGKSRMEKYGDIFLKEIEKANGEKSE